MSIQTVNIPVPVSGDGPIINVSTLVGPKTVLLSGTFSGRYELLASHNGANFVPILQFNAGGIEGIEQTVNGAFQSFRIRANGTPSSAVTCDVSAVVGVGENYFAVVASLASGASGLTPVVDTYPLFPPTGAEQEINFICEGSFRGSVVVLGSLDNVDWNPIGAFRIDAVPAGSPGVFEFTAMLTPDKTRYIRLNIDGVTTGAVTVTMGGRIPATGGGIPVIPVATWTGCRYIFLDGDNGNDALIGYIDAPLGTVFTPAQAAAVAVKTTHRINEIRPPVGAGRDVVVLMKPRAGKARYDALTPGDGLGSDDRSQRSEYASMITRASDLTNSVADRQTLGFATAIPGPNPDGSFTVNYVSATQLGLAGATLPAGWILTRYRLRIETAASGTIYAAIKWGDQSAVPNPEILTYHVMPGIVAPDDKVWIEEPTLVLHDYTEASGADYNAALRAYALVIQAGHCYLATMEDGPVAQYAYLHVTGGAVLQTLGNGSVAINNRVVDETSNLRINTAFGIWAPPLSTLGGDNTESVQVEFSSFCNSAQATADALVLRARRMVCRYNEIQNLEIQDGADSAVLDSLLAGPIVLHTTGHVRVVEIRYVPYWGFGTSVIASDIDSATTQSLEIEFVSAIVAWGVNPSVPGYVLGPGVYTVKFDLDGVVSISQLPGSGVELQFDFTDLTKSILVSYESLNTTGFEIEDGQKILCRLTDGTLYPGGELPCPRGKIMQLVDRPAEV